jgi:phosphohistidine swiveling domain-containing protein
VITSHSSSDEAGRLAGGKGRSLHVLSKNGLPVPEWAVLGSDLFTRTLDSGLRKTIHERLHAVSINTVEQVSADLSELIFDTRLDETVEAEIERAYRAVGGGRVAVRSSGADEDGESMSFAGQFATRLNVRGSAAVREAVLACWASAFSARSLTYRLANGGLANGSLPEVGAMAVVVQRMVDAERSGVLFTINPLTGDQEECVVSAVYGLGESLVSGAVDADTVTLRKDTGTIVDTVIGDKAERLDADGVHEVPEEQRIQPALAEADLAGLRDLARQVEQVYGAPQDVEWAIDADGRLWLLQSRPVTATATATGAGGELRIWDNSNIIESFSGITSPLTYSFAADAYAKVYRGYAKALRVPDAQLRQMDNWLPSMLGYFHGRVYYNLLHWYRMVRLAPAYPLTRRVLEVSLGVEESVDPKLADTLHPFTFRTKAGQRLSNIVQKCEFARRFLTMGRTVDRFIVDFYRAYEVFDNEDYDAMSGAATYRRFRELERDLLEKWGPMMTLDATILLSFGGLYLLTRKWLPDAPEWFNWAVVNPGAGIESAEPALALAELAATVRADPALTELITTTPPEKTRQALEDGAHRQLLAEIDRYVTRYGYRSPDELKLEVPDLREDPAMLFTMLRDALPESASSQSDSAQEYLDAHLRGPRRWVYELVRRKTRTSLANRERLRFCRTRAFGSAKRMLRAMGRDLAAMDAINEWTDVFQLRMEELRGAFEGTISHTELPELVAMRKAQRKADELLRAPSRFTTRGAAYWNGNLPAGGWALDSDDRKGLKHFRGTPSCPGIAEGEAVVTDKPEQVNGGILVAYRTDPGWVAALASSAGLVIERGSPLTHVAIVARELRVPTVVQIKDITRELRSGMRVRIDGSTGEVLVLSDEREQEPVS